jgi:hypothetical protein
MEDRSTFSILRSCNSTGWRPATRNCTEDVRYTKLSSQSPLQVEMGDISLGKVRLGPPDPRVLVGLELLQETKTRLCGEQC